MRTIGTGTTPRALAPSAIIRRIEDAIADVDGELADGWHVSHHPYPTFPPPLDTGDVIHQSFAVGLLDSEFGIDDRQRSAVGLHTASELAVRYCALLPADDKRSGYLRYLDLEHEIVARVLACNALPDLELRALGVETRQAVSNTTLVGELRFAIRHMYAIE